MEIIGDLEMRSCVEMIGEETPLRVLKSNVGRNNGEKHVNNYFEALSCEGTWRNKQDWKGMMETKKDF